MTTSLCLLVWNELEGCTFDLPRIDLRLFDEVFAVDGGSTDGTVEFLQRNGVEVRRQPRPSLNAAYWHAVETSACENVVVFFPKGRIDPGILREIKVKLEDGYELVVPSRIGRGARNEEDDKLFRPRKWGVAALALASAGVWLREGNLILDVLHGIKGFSRRAFLQMNPSPAGLTIDLEMTIRAYKHRIRRCQFPVVESARPGVASHFPILPTGVRLGRCFLREIWSTPAPAGQVGLSGPAEAVSGKPE